MKLGLSLFLLCLYSLYFIRNPYFVLGKEQVKRSKSMLYTEIGIGCLVFILINVPYNGDNLIHLLAVIGILNWGLELYLRILAVKGDSSLSLEHKPMLIKKAKKDFYSVIVNDTLRMYKNDDIRMYNFDCITDTIVEVITTCNTYTLLTVHLL